MRYEMLLMKGARFRLDCLWLGMACFIFLIPVGAQGGLSVDALPDFQPISADSGHGGLFPEKENDIKANLLAAEILSINIDIDSYEKDKKGAAQQQNIPALEERICILSAMAEKMRSLDPAHFSLPIKRRIRIHPTRVYGIGSVLETGESQSKKAIYRAAGIQGGDFSLLEPGRWYSLEVYILRARDIIASVPEYYVYIMAPSEPGPGFFAPDDGASSHEKQ